MAERRQQLRDDIHSHGPEHFAMEHFGRIRRPWMEYARLTYGQAIQLTPAEHARHETVVCAVTRAALLMDPPPDDFRVARDLFGLPEFVTSIGAWQHIEVDGWNMGAAYSTAFAADEDRRDSRKYHAVKQYHQWRTVLALLDRLIAADVDDVAVELTEADIDELLRTPVRIP